MASDRRDALLRLARMYAELVRVQFGESRLSDAADALVRDLEAVERDPAPERRTITRAQYGAGVEILSRLGTVQKIDVEDLLDVWSITVEDA